MILKLSQLVEKKACLQQVSLFKELFGDEVDVTEELCLKVFNEFDWHWGAKNLLSVELYAEYEKVRAAALAEYVKVEAPACAEYKKVRDAALAEYEKVEAAALTEYLKIKAPAWAEYKKVESVTFAKLYNKQGEVK